MPHRLLHAALLVAALLFSQWAVAMHACAAAGMAVPSAHAASNAHAPCCPEPAVPNTCEQHCAFGHAAVDAAKPHAFADVTLGAALVVPAVEPARFGVRLDRPAAVAPDPPPSIRSSVLRI